MKRKSNFISHLNTAYQEENRVLIECPTFATDDFEFLSKSSEVNIIKANVLHFRPLPPDVVLVIFDLAKNLSYNFTYDFIKYSLTRLFLLFNKKSKRNGIVSEKFILHYDEHIFSFEASFPLTDEQKDKLIDAAIDSITNKIDKD